MKQYIYLKPNSRNLESENNIKTNDRGEKMKIIFKVFFNDIKAIMKNAAAFIIILGVCILPSLYAWINIKACWNPYANTGNLPIAIVNLDEGSVFNGKDINVGNQIVAELKKNKSIGWVFIDQWQANYGLNNGCYYALIEIPADFSKGLVSLSSTNPVKPTIVYRVNEKLNAIAVKITNTAKNQLAEKIKSSFVSTVNNEALKELNSLGNKVGSDKSQLLQLKDSLNKSKEDISLIQKNISEATANSASFSQELSNTKTALPHLTEQINDLQKATEASKDLLYATKQTINNTSSGFNDDIVQIQTINDENQALLSKLKEINNSSDTSNMIAVIDELISSYQSLNNLANENTKKLSELNSTLSNQQISDLVNMLNLLNATSSGQIANLDNLKTIISSGASKDSINSNIDKLSDTSNDITKEIANASNYFYSNTYPALKRLSDSLNANLDKVDDLLQCTKAVVPELNAVANLGITSSKLSADQAKQLSSKLINIQNSLNSVNDKMSGLNENTINQILNIMELNPNDIANFLSSPIGVKKIEIYNTGIFGVGLTPFYTVLAIWVGSLLLTSLLSVECEDNIAGQKLNLKQKHFGKMLLFLFLSIIQAAIVTLGDKFILGVKPENMGLMLLFALISSVTFTVIIFTLVSLFGNLGKAVAVVIMVFQIAGSGGIYPIQTNPKIFGLLQPIWPFTYAINGFREAIAGPIWTSVLTNIGMFGVYILVFLLLSILKVPLHKFTKAFEHKFKEAGL